MNSEPDDFQEISPELRPLMAARRMVKFTDEDLAETARIVREGAQAYLDSVIVPFESAKVEPVLESAGFLAAAFTKFPKRFPVILLEEDADESKYTPAGAANLLEGPVEDSSGKVFVLWEWIPEGNTAGFDGLLAVLKAKETGVDCGRGILRETPQGWRIQVDQGDMDALWDLSGRSHVIYLEG